MRCDLCSVNRFTMFSFECFERCNVISSIEVARTLTHTYTHVQPYATVAVQMAPSKSPLIQQKKKENTNTAVSGSVIF